MKQITLLFIDLSCEFLPTRVMFSDYPDQVYVSVKAGLLVLGDARILHAAGTNVTDDR